MVDDATEEEDTVVKGGAPPPSAVPTTATFASDEEGLPQVDVEAELAVIDPSERYPVERELGHGGMGLVHLCHDKQIGRHVAMKMVSASHRDNRSVVARFVREARLQAQLEHPAVVPVYELGRDPSGHAYFTMKRIRGLTLRALIDRLLDRDPDALETYTRRKLLSDFSRVCLAVDYAHRAGVVHRDIKPANVMLGEYGEVYLLDWGIAKMQTEHKPSHRMLGTAGYMAPEQIGDASAVGPAADVYALGCVLFEILTLQRAHPAERVEARLASTLEKDVRLPSSIDDDVAPELDVMCMRATARDPAQRYGSARELHVALEHHLDGERDLALRRSLSQTHAEHAREAAQRLQSGDDPHVVRREALREVGQALALDPSNRDAMTTMVELLTRPPDAPPHEVEEQLEIRRQRWFKASGRVAAAIYFSMALYLPFLWWVGIRDAASIATFLVLSAIAGLLSLRATFMQHPRERDVIFAMLTSTIAMAATATLYGPLVLTPGMIAVNGTAYALTVGKRARMLTLGVATLAVLVPLLLELGGAIAPSYALDSHGMTILPRALGLHHPPALVLLAIASLGMIATGIVAVGRIRDALDRAERQLESYNWHFRQLLPGRDADHLSR
jgi:serine/threonine protein kinase